MRRTALRRAVFALSASLLLSICLPGCANEDARFVYTRACEYLDAENFEEAESEFYRLIDYGYYIAESYRGIGLAHLRQANYPDACVAFERALINITTQDEAFRRDVQLYLARARTLRGETDKAVAIYDELLAKEEDPEIYFLRGNIHMNAGEEAAAKEDFDKAVSMSGDYALYINIYHIYEAAGKNADGSRYLEGALRLVNEEGRGGYERGIVYYHLRDYEKAKEELLNALMADPQNGNAILLLGRVHLSMGNVSDARAMFKEHLDDETNAAAAYNGLALCDMAQEDYAAALLNIQKGLTYEDEKAAQSLLFNQLIVYEHLHEWETAKNLAAAYLGRYPEDESALREFEFLKTRVPE